MIERTQAGLIPFPTQRLIAGDVLPCPLYIDTAGTPRRWHEAGEPISRGALAGLVDETVFIENQALGGFASFLMGRMERALERAHRDPLECGRCAYDAGWAVLSDYFGRPEVTVARAKVARLAALMATASARAGALAAVISAQAVAVPAIHGVRVAAMALALGRARGLGDASSRHLAEGALLHDLGEAVMPPLTIESDTAPWAEAARAQHPSVGFGLLRAHGDLGPMLSGCVLAHHERLHGGGVPYGLSGDAVPLGGRVVGLVDAVDVHQAAHPALSLETGLSAVVAEEPGGFEPALIGALADACCS